jgi:hypothetical protein|tara:strand:- start:1058 stop:1738 length:681 start_codon:yes stop_codon:yes gene_type:complete
MKKKTKNQEMIQQLMDEGDYAPLYPFISQSKLTDLQKLLVGLMCNDIYMNGTITWKHQTYGDKLNVSRQTIFNNIKSLTSIGVIIPGFDNKAGGKSNTYSISFSAISEYKTCKDGDTTCKGKIQVPPVKLEQEPVKLETQPVKIETKPVKIETKPVKAALHIKKPKESNKENNKESKEDIFDNVSFFGNNKIKNSNQEYLDSRKKELTNIDIDLLGSTDFFDGLDI